VINAYLRLIRFDKPIGTLLLLWPTLWALWISYAAIPPFGVLVAFVGGVFLTRAAGCAINDYADSDFDGKVERTANRPLATGVISKKSALLITAILSIGAFLLAWFCLKRITLLWSIPALLIFVSYPFFKRFFPIPQLYLGIAFSFGILMAFIEAVNLIPIIAIALFMANLFWVLAYDTIYALVDLPDDLKIGIKTSAITFGRHVIAIVMLCYVMFVLLLTYVGYIADLNWCYWLSVLIIIGLIIYVYVQIKHKDRDSCFRAFLFNNNIGIVLFVGIVLSYLVK
jgi:4-hydroxybenzoate polyprenyltransferase